jgi:holin-like protein
MVVETLCLGSGKRRVTYAVARPRIPGIAHGIPVFARDLTEAGLHLDRAADCVDDAAELDDRAVPGALDDAPLMGRDGGVAQVAVETPRRTSVRSSSAPASRLYPTTSATIIAASFRGVAHSAPPARRTLARILVPVRGKARIDRAASFRPQTRHDPRILHPSCFSADRRGLGARARASGAGTGDRVALMVAALPLYRRWRPFNEDALGASELEQAARGLLACLAAPLRAGGRRRAAVSGALREQGLALAAALVISTVVTLVATVGVFLLVKRFSGTGEKA